MTLRLFATSPRFSIHVLTVSRNNRYLADLMEKIAHLEKAKTTDSAEDVWRQINHGVGAEMERSSRISIQNMVLELTEGAHFEHFQPTERISGQDDGHSLSGDTLEAEDTELTNPLTATPSRYLSASDGKACKSHNHWSHYVAIQAR